MMIILHEYGHYIAANYFNLRISQVRIGELLFSIGIGKVKLSPFILSGEVEVEDNITHIINYKLFICNFIGIYYQIIFQGLLLLAYINLTVILISTIINIMTMLYSICPFLKSDLSEYLKVIKLVH